MPYFIFCRKITFFLIIYILFLIFKNKNLVISKIIHYFAYEK